jgi:hypothetical protein
MTELPRPSNNRVAWCRVERYSEPRPWCEAPRHEGQRRPAAVVAAFTGPDVGDDLVQAMCAECVGAIAADLGITVDEGMIE